MSNEDEFYDAVTGLESDESCEGLSEASFKDARGFGYSAEKNNGSVPQKNGIKKHRTSLPAPMSSRNSVSIWGILKKCIGLELSKITMPIAFNEPLSFLQRISEYMEHACLLNRACELSNSLERMEMVASFAISAVGSQWGRTGKPFNPLLGETFELIREDPGYRLVSEQVSHHPPISAFHAESLSGDFVFHGSIYPKLKFWGKSVEAEPRGTMTLELLKHNEVYTWSNPTCCVHNIILGKLWIEQYGTMEIINHSTGEKCVLEFKPSGMLGKDLHKVEGYIQEKSKKKFCVLYGKWTGYIWAVNPHTYETYKKSEKKDDKTKKNEELENAENYDEYELPELHKLVHAVPGSSLLWRIQARPLHSVKMYNFTNFAMALNELEPGMEAILAPTDCRFRPDIRAMENGDIDEASKEKERLEEKQRAARKERANHNEGVEPQVVPTGHQPVHRLPGLALQRRLLDRNYKDLPDLY